jgi:hypothetical protein
MEKLRIASLIIHGLFKADQRLTCQNTMRSLEHRDWRCFFRPLCVEHNGFTQRDVSLLLTDFHFPDTIFRAWGWMMGLKHTEHICEVKYSLVVPIETYRLRLYLNCFPPQSWVALQVGALARSSDFSRHYGCDRCHGISLCSVRNKPSFSASHLIFNAVIE